MSVPLFAAPLSFAGTPTAGVNETQRLTVTGTPDGGTMDLGFGGDTVEVPYNSTAAGLQALLESLASIDLGEVACSGGPLPGTAIDITFQNGLGGKNVAAITVDDAGLTGGTDPAAAISTPTAGVRGTYRGARYGQILMDTTNGVLYEQTSLSPSTPTWSEVDP